MCSILRDETNKNKKKAARDEIVHFDSNATTQEQISFLKKGTLFVNLAMIVELHSDVLLHVSDLFARGVENKLGLLLGYGLDDRLVVVKPIELAQVDPQYLEKRYSLFKDVYPNLSIVGVYEIEEQSG